jgi:POT family proton-dependent oligopeptide transporter
MALSAAFLVALLLPIVGTGCLKGNISVQVGHLYSPEEEGRRTRAFAIFSAAINAGALLGPLTCGILAQAFGWHVGFGAAGVMCSKCRASPDLTGLLRDARSWKQCD